VKIRRIKILAVIAAAMSVVAPAFATCSNIVPPCTGTATYGPGFFACSTDGTSCCYYTCGKMYCNGVYVGLIEVLLQEYPYELCIGNNCTTG